MPLTKPCTGSTLTERARGLEGIRIWTRNPPLDVHCRTTPIRRVIASLALHGTSLQSSLRYDLPVLLNNALCKVIAEKSLQLLLCSIGLLACVQVSQFLPKPSDHRTAPFLGQTLPRVDSEHAMQDVYAMPVTSNDCHSNGSCTQYVSFARPPIMKITDLT